MKNRHGKFAVFVALLVGAATLLYRPKQPASAPAGRGQGEAGRIESQILQRASQAEESSRKAAVTLSASGVDESPTERGARPTRTEIPDDEWNKKLRPAGLSFAGYVFRFFSKIDVNHVLRYPDLNPLDVKLSQEQADSLASIIERERESRVMLAEALNEAYVAEIAWIIESGTQPPVAEGPGIFRELEDGRKRVVMRVSDDFGMSLHGDRIYRFEYAKLDSFIHAMPSKARMATTLGGAIVDYMESIGVCPSSDATRIGEELAEMQAKWL